MVKQHSALVVGGGIAGLQASLDLAQNDTEWNDTFIHDTLRYGFKGFEQMTDAELSEALEEIDYE